MATRKKRRFLLCISNRGCEDLEPRKVYEQLPDDPAAKEGLVRIIDESGEDYIYPSDLFVLVKLPAAVARRLKRPSRPKPNTGRREVRRAG